MATAGACENMNQAYHARAIARACPRSKLRAGSAGAGGSLVGLESCIPALSKSLRRTHAPVCDDASKLRPTGPHEGLVEARVAMKARLG